MAVKYLMQQLKRGMISFVRKNDCMLAAAELRELVMKIAVGNDTVAYKKLFMLYYHKMVSFSFSITRSKESAEEVVSDVFLKLWKSRHSLKDVQNFHLYVYIMTKNASLNYLQKEKKNAFFSLDDVIVNLPELSESPEQLLISSEINKRLQLAITQLPPKCRLIFKLIKEDGLKYKEVAELLEISQKTVEAQITIAMKRVGESIRFYTSSIILN